MASSPFLIGLLCTAAAVVLQSGLHTVAEGHIAVYWRGGALLASLGGPGFHVKLPLVTTMAQLQVSDTPSARRPRPTVTHCHNHMMISQVH